MLRGFGSYTEPYKHSSAEENMAAPWTDGPRELLQHAVDHLAQGRDFDPVLPGCLENRFTLFRLYRQAVYLQSDHPFPLSRTRSIASSERAGGAGSPDTFWTA